MHFLIAIKLDDPVVIFFLADFREAVACDAIKTSYGRKDVELSVTIMSFCGTAMLDF
nr:hypothetical protein [Marinicella sp. W31]MDC2877128.1 hypothetical protein [Marinicella sp. W31]